METTILALAILRIISLLIAAYIALKYQSWCGFMVALLLVWVVILNTLLGFKDVATFVGTPFTFLLCYYIIANSKRNKQ